MPHFSRNLWLLLGQNVAVFLGIALQALILNLYLVALGYREDFIGLVAFAQTAAIGLGALPAGWLSPRLGPRRCMIAATLLLATSFCAMAVIEHPLGLLAASALNGLSMALIFVPSAPYLMENSRSEEWRTAFAANFAALSVASVVGNAIGGVLPGLVAGDPTASPEQAVVGYRAALLVGGALAALGVVPLLLADDRRIAEPPAGGGARPAPAGAPSAPPRSLRRDMAAMIVAVACLAAATALVVAFFNVFLRDEIGVRTEAIGTIFALGALMMAPASLGAPALARRWGSIPTIALSRLLVVPLIALLLLPSPGLTLAATAFVGRQALMSIGQPLDNAYIMELVPARLRARAAALRTLAWNGGWAAATALGGLAIVWLGYRAIFLAAVGLTLASVIVHWRAFRGR
ncbi:MAG TPA: MFS transporter [Chloroflexota bacterium]